MKLSCLFHISSKLYFKDCYVYTVSVERYLFLPMNSDLDLNLTLFRRFLIPELFRNRSITLRSVIHNNLIMAESLSVHDLFWECQELTQ